tara:strand:+ start:155 stop:658 length:504 start_codon:yes stop_codon:yes gene_type:complete
MPNYIKPTFTLTANKNSASGTPGPLSVALALSTSQQLTVDNVQSAIVTPNALGSTEPTKLLDGSSLTGTNFTGGTHGCYLYLKNTTGSGSGLIYVGIVHAGGSDSPADPDAYNATNTNLNYADDASLRTFTLKAGEFAFLPWDYLGDIFCHADTANQELEYWLFDRA